MYLRDSAHTSPWMMESRSGKIPTSLRLLISLLSRSFIRPSRAGKRHGRDVAAPDPFVVAAGGGVPFRTADLLGGC
jgi:hypothetical protein